MAAEACSAGTIVYDNFQAPGGYTLSDYNAKWETPFGLGEMAINDTRNFNGGTFNISAAPFQTASDFSVYDHIKYVAVSTQSFAVPKVGSLTFSSTIQAQTPGVQPGRVIDGTYIQSGLPYSAPTMEVQQAAAVMNMLDFKTGQLFDIFISGNQAATLIERLPSAVTNPNLTSADPGYVGINDAYTQFINVIPVGSGPHNASITYNSNGSVSYFIDGVEVSHVDNVGIPLDKQGQPYSGVYPSYGPGEPLAGDIQSFQIGTGLFSVVDPFPFQLADRPDLAVSIPLENRIFGQGVIASFGNVEVGTTAVPEPSAWTMLILGVGIIGLAARRRNAGAALGA